MLGLCEKRKWQFVVLEIALGLWQVRTAKWQSKWGMIECNTSKFKDTDMEVIIEKISIAVKEITLANDRMTFIEQMISLSKLLMAHDLHISSAYNGIDEKAQVPTYFVADYIDTIGFADIEL